MKVSIVEMEGLLRGKCVPAKMLVNESLAEYLVRQFDAIHERAEAAERERDELRKILQATQGGATEAIKNVMRLQEEISRLNKESQRLSDQLGACDRQRLDWLKRALTAEAEIARRDAAAGEPVAYTSQANLDAVSLKQPKQLEFMTGDKGIYRNPISLYTAAPPAELPDIEPLIEGALKLHGLRTREAGHSQLSDGFRNGARWAAKELGAQPHKPVVLPHRRLATIVKGHALKTYPLSFFDPDEVIAMLESAGVTYEVKK